MSERYEGDATFASGDPLAPERIEETIVAAQAREIDDSRTETTLVRTLTAAYALPPESDAALARVHARLSTATLASARPAEEGDEVEYERSRGWRNEPTPLKVRHGSRFGASLRALAAVLVVALLGAGFYAALHRPATSTSRPGQAEQPGWHDVGITQARATQPLDFDPAQGVHYAVNEVTGDIYACGGSGHIWYSTDGGASYAPFAVMLPSYVSGTVDCSIATVPGASGLFIRLVTGSPARFVAYVSAPGKLAAMLQTPSTATSLADPAEQTTINPDQLLAMFFFGSLIGPVRMAGSLLYATVWDEQLSRTVLLGTPDFGQHWYWLDAPITIYSSYSVGVVDTFAVDPADPSRLFLGVHPGPTADGLPSIAMSTNGGKTWQPLLSAIPYGMALVGASNTAVYGSAQDDAAGHTALLRRDLTTPGATWQRVTQMPATQMPPGGARVLDVGPDGTVYAIEALKDGNVRAYTLAPGATAFRLVWPQTALTPPSHKFAFALGGIWPGGQPALYVNSLPGPSTSPALYRLALG